MERTPQVPRAAVLATCLLMALAGRAVAQVPAGEADPADVASVDAILTAVYDVISGPAGQARNWDRFRSLFLPEARLIATGIGPDGPRYRAMTPAEYVQSNAAGLTDSGFTEREVARTVETFGNIVHAFSTYESRYTRAGQPGTARGINSMQLYNDGKRWWVVTIFWDSERPDNPIPPKYLPRQPSIPEHGGL